jgi:5-methylcytosine-specific restriction endonuclease McrA
MPNRPPIHKPLGYRPREERREPKVADPYYRSQHWLELRGRVGDRDGWRCVKCGEPAKTIHHVVHRPKGEPGPTAADVDSNCECLCGKCHGREHPEKGRYDRMVD